MYMDKLDGTIEARFFDQKQAERRDEQNRLMDSMVSATWIVFSRLGTLRILPATSKRTDSHERRFRKCNQGLLSVLGRGLFLSLSCDIVA
ncbi:MAG: hypothetical protein JWN70_3101 [Planctomycetaceae bacterium]|nr:hypothetical protein [Planctomycetaceae bacterium]